MQKHPGNSEKLAIFDFGAEVHTPQFFKVPAEEHVVLIDATCLESAQGATASAKARDVPGPASFAGMPAALRSCGTIGEEKICVKMLS